MRNPIMLVTATLLLSMTITNAAQATVDEPYAKDLTFGANGMVNDTMVNLNGSPSTSARPVGQHLALGEDGSTVVAALGTKFDTLTGNENYLMVTRYNASGQRQAWSNPSTNYADTTGEYLFVPPNAAPDNLRIAAVKDVKIGPYGDINVLIDAWEPAGDTTDSLVVTFGEDGAYKGIVTHMATPFVDDLGVAMIIPGSSMYIVSSHGSLVDVGLYSMNYSDGVPDPDAGYGNSGKTSQSLFNCQKVIAGQPVTVPCPLRARRALLSGTSTMPLYVAGEYDQGSGTESSVFVLSFNGTPGAPTTGFPITWGFAGINDGMHGLALRYKFNIPTRPQHELYLLDGFQRPCGYGFVVARFNADTGAFLNRSYTKGGSTTTDPNDCASTTSLLANDLALAHDYYYANRYIAVVGGQSSGEPFTGQNAFLALIDSENMHSEVQVQAFTNHAGQYPDDTMLHAVQGRVVDGSYTYTATGVTWNYDHAASQVVTMRLQADRIFQDGLAAN
ncbi:MAG: hypothetical protein L0H70_00755 [Xanthomonadales bacterium]|nr:hypothetical protein [Xanthomonadales bacterium]